MSEENQKQNEINWEEIAAEYLDGWKRAKADYLNREKEIVKEREALRQIFEESIILEFLPVLDNLKTALNSDADDSAFRKGIEHIVKQFEDTLKNFGFEKIEILGKEFDPALCEAAEKQGEGNTVTKVIIDGYKKGERVVRAARVAVG